MDKKSGFLTRTLFVAFCAVGISVTMLLIADKDVGLAFSKLLDGAFGSRANFARTLRTAAPLIFMALSFAVALRGQMFNAGGQGQLYVGAFGATAAALLFPGVPKWPLMFMCLIAGIVCGMLWAYIPALLKVRFQCSEVVTTLMMNYIALYFTEYLVREPFYVPGAVGESGSTANIPESLSLTTLVRGSELTTEIIIAIVVLFAVWFWSKRTRSGYEVEIVGSNAEAAKYSGIKVESRQVLSMCIGGAVAGLCGALEILGVFHRFVIDFTPNIGFNGIVVSLMAGNSYGFIPLTALFLGSLESGSRTMEMFGNVPRSLVDILIGVILVVVTIKETPHFGLKRALRKPTHK